MGEAPVGIRRRYVRKPERIIVAAEIGQRARRFASGGAAVRWSERGQEVIVRTGDPDRVLRDDDGIYYGTKIRFAGRGV